MLLPDTFLDQNCLESAFWPYHSSNLKPFRWIPINHRVKSQGQVLWSGSWGSLQNSLSCFPIFLSFMNSIVFTNRIMLSYAYNVNSCPLHLWLWGSFCLELPIPIPFLHGLVLFILQDPNQMSPFPWTFYILIAWSSLSLPAKLTTLPCLFYDTWFFFPFSKWYYHYLSMSYHCCWTTVYLYPPQY